MNLSVVKVKGKVFFLSLSLSPSSFLSLTSFTNWDAARDAIKTARGTARLLVSSKPLDDSFDPK